MVDKIGFNPFLGPADKTDKTAPKTGQFQDILGRTMAKTEEAGASARTQATLAVDPVASLKAKAALNPLNQVERTLSLLDRLGDALNDPQTTAKDMAPLIGSLDQESESLLQAASQLPETDQARQVLEETALLAKVQVAKFERGDFV